MTARRSLACALLLLGAACSVQEADRQSPTGREVPLEPVGTPSGYSAPTPQSSQTAAGLPLLPALSPTDTAISPYDAFSVEVTVLDAATLGVRFMVDECCYLYRDKTAFALHALDGSRLRGGLRLGAIDLPAGEATTDEFFGRTEVYRRSLAVQVPLEGASPAAGFALDVTYQGCREKGVALCYEPITRRFPVYRDAAGLTVGAASLVDKRRP